MIQRDAHAPPSQLDSWPTAPVPPATPLRSGAPAYQDHELYGRDGQRVVVHASQLAATSSQEPSHRHLGAHAPKNWRCGACRWFEVAIYRLIDSTELPNESFADTVPPDTRYVVHTVGRSNVPGEIDFGRVAPAATPHKVLELLTQWNQSRPRLPNASAEAVDAAAMYDGDLDAAYDEWSGAGVR